MQSRWPGFYWLGTTIWACLIQTSSGQSRGASVYPLYVAKAEKLF
jgi:hypothetical protein